MIRIRLMFLVLICGLASSAQGVTDLVVAENYIAAADQDYRYLWIINRKSHQVAATIRVDELPRQFIRELRDLRIGVTELLVQTDPASVLGLPSGDGKQQLYTLRDRFPYPLSSTDYQVERLHGWRVPGRGVRDVWKRLFLFPSLPDTPLYYDREAAHLVIGARRVPLDTDNTGPGSWGDAIPDLPRGKIYVPFSRGGKYGVAVMRLEMGKDDSDRSILEDVAVEEFFVDTNVGGHGVVSPKGNRLYLVSESSLKVIDLRKQRIIGDVSLVKALPAYQLQFVVALSPEGGELYLLETTQGVLQARDSGTHEVLWRIRLPR